MDTEEEVFMVMRGKLAKLMALAAPEIYCPYINIGYNGCNVLYVKLCCALYGCLKSVLLFHKNISPTYMLKDSVSDHITRVYATKSLTGHR